MKIGLQKTSLVNYPGRVAAAVFLPGCNLRCPFCHNAKLAEASVVSGPHFDPTDSNEYISLEEAYEHLNRRAKVLSGIAISGGEPLLSPALVDLIKKAKSLGLAVKIDTNGTLPDRLISILENKETRPDMISIDIKTSLSRYGELTIEGKNDSFAGTALRRTLSLFANMTANDIPRIEYRTVLIPGLVGEKEIREIGTLLPHDADWQFAQFVPGVCLDPLWNNKEPYSNAEIRRLVDIAKSSVSKAVFR